MILVLNAEQEEFKNSLRRFVTEQADLKKIRATQDAGEGFDKGTWQKLATDLGVVYRAPHRGTWQRVGHLPAVAVLQLKSGPDGRIYAATHGRGLYAIRLP